MAPAVSWLFDASKIASLGRGVEARGISGPPNRPRAALPVGRWDLAEEKGAEKGNDVSALCETLRLESAGRENRCAGRDVRALCDRSRVVRAIRSVN
jgi:hypothetical protein